MHQLLSSLRFSGQFIQDQTATLKAFQSLHAATRQALLQQLELDDDAFMPVDRQAVAADAAKYRQAIERQVQPHLTAIHDEVPRDVIIRQHAVHVHQPEWERDFIADEVVISRPGQREVQIIPRHMGQHCDQFWSSIIAEAKKPVAERVH